MTTKIPHRFVFGDRFIYDNKGIRPETSNRRIGAKGTIMAIPYGYADRYVVHAMWDDDRTIISLISDECRYIPKKARAPTKPKRKDGEFLVGDKVRYKSKDPNKNSFWSVWSAKRAGWTGTVIKVEKKGGAGDIIIYVNWDDVRCRGGSVFSHVVELIKKAHTKKDSLTIEKDSLTIEKALEFLKTQGVATFKKTWKPVEVTLNDEYNAVVHEDTVHVGCQKFTHDAVMKVANAIRRVKKNMKEDTK